MNSIWTIIIFAITISILVVVHEFGHFWVARRCGVRVLCFSVGFGKKLFSYTSKQGTEFVLSCIPLGGYVKMLDSRASDVTAEERPFAFDHKTILQRAAIVSAGPIANFILAFIIYWVVFQIGVMSYPVKVAQITPNSIAAFANIPLGAELKSISGIKVDDQQELRVALIGEVGEETLTIGYLPEHESTPVFKTVNLHNWRFDLEKDDPVKSLGIVLQGPTIRPILSQVQANSAADKAGLVAGDKIINYNGKPLTDWQIFAAQIRTGDPLKLGIERAHQTFLVDVQPDKRLSDDGKTTIGVVGVTPTLDLIKTQYTLFTAIGKSLSQTASMIKLTVWSFYKLIIGDFSLKNLSGPISIAKSAEQTASYGIVPYLHFLAFISISLGVVNLVPLPMLDGGHLVFLAVERIKGRPLSERSQAVFYRIGFMLLMMLMVVALFNDFLRLST